MDALYRNNPDAIDATVDGLLDELDSGFAHQSLHPAGEEPRQYPSPALARGVLLLGDWWPAILCLIALIAMLMLGVAL